MKAHGDVEPDLLNGAEGIFTGRKRRSRQPHWLLCKGLGAPYALTTGRPGGPLHNSAGRVRASTYGVQMSHLLIYYLMIISKDRRTHTASFIHSAVSIDVNQQGSMRSRKHSIVCLAQ